MRPIPFRLQGRPRLLAADVAQVFHPLIVSLLGELDARNFARRAGIRNAQKQCARSYSVIQARAMLEADAPTTVKLAALAPSGKGWACTGVRFHMEYVGGPESSHDTPYVGTFRYGGTGRDHSIPFTAVGWDHLTSLASANGDFADPATGNVLAEVDLIQGNTDHAFVLTAIFKTQHQR